MLSRSGETWRPSTSTSSPTLPITVTDDGSTTSARPRRKRAPPTPPESTATLGIVGDTTEAVNPEHTPPETRYARSGDVHIAFQVAGEGPVDLVATPAGSHHVELVWENPPQARFFNRLASISRLILFDKRGTGMSDRVSGAPTLEARMDDIRVVMDAAGSERAVLWGPGRRGSALHALRGHVPGANPRADPVQLDATHDAST